MSVAENLKAIQERVHLATLRAGRPEGSARLMGVTKTHGPEIVRQAYDAGLRLMGESYIQEATGKIPSLPADIEWHMIGHLQSNKAKKAVELFPSVQSVDRVSLAQALDKAASDKGVVVDAMFEVNVGGEESKAGASEDAILELACMAGKWKNLKFTGLMAIPPYLDDPEEVRPYFKRVRLLAERINAQACGITITQLSMGMSHDFEVAIEEGATIVRVGTALFGSRQ